MSGPRCRSDDRKDLKTLIRSAAHEVIIISPYFVPGDDGVALMRELRSVRRAHPGPDEFAGLHRFAAGAQWVRPLSLSHSWKLGVELSEVRPKLGHEAKAISPVSQRQRQTVTRLDPKLAAGPLSAWATCCETKGGSTKCWPSTIGAGARSPITPKSIFATGRCFENLSPRRRGPGPYWNSLAAELDVDSRKEDASDPYRHWARPWTTFRISFTRAMQHWNQRKRSGNGELDYRRSWLICTASRRTMPNRSTPRCCIAWPGWAIRRRCRSSSWACPARAARWSSRSWPAIPWCSAPAKLRNAGPTGASRRRHRGPGHAPG